MSAWHSDTAQKPSPWVQRACYLKGNISSHREADTLRPNSVLIVGLWGWKEGTINLPGNWFFSEDENTKLSVTELPLVLMNYISTWTTSSSINRLWEVFWERTKVHMIVSTRRNNGLEDLVGRVKPWFLVQKPRFLSEPSLSGLLTAQCQTRSGVWWEDVLSMMCLSK